MFKIHYHFKQTENLINFFCFILRNFYRFFLIFFLLNTNLLMILVVLKRTNPLTPFILSSTMNLKLQNQPTSDDIISTMLILNISQTNLTSLNLTKTLKTCCVKTRNFNRLIKKITTNLAFQMLSNSIVILVKNELSNTPIISIILIKHYILN